MRKVLFLGLFLGFVSAGSLVAQTLTVMTEVWPPFNYVENGKPVGISTEVVLEIQKRLGLALPIVTQPWPRSYDAIQKTDNQVLYSMTLTDDRKPLFKWVGPLGEFNSAFYGKKGGALKMAAFDDAKKASRIAVAIGTPDEDSLKKAGFTNIDATVDVTTMVKKLMADRDELILASEISLRQSLVQNGFKVEDVSEVFMVARRPLYIAFSKNVPDATITAWQKALDAIKADGTYDKIYAKYLKK